MPSRAAKTVCLALAFCGIAGLSAAQSAARPSTAESGDPIRIDAVPVPLNPQDPSVSSIGDFHYAGGLWLRTPQAPRFHELSDIVITGQDRLAAVGDGGIFFSARLVFASDQRLIGISDARLESLTDERGQALTAARADAEGLAIFPNGDRLVSFERDHRIWLYPAAGGPPRPAPAPAGKLPANAGLEALALDPAVTADAYLVGAEMSGETWTCRMAASCVKGPTVDKPAEFGLVAINRLGEDKVVYLLRAYDPFRGVRIMLQVLRSTTVIAQMDMAVPLTLDNFEGLASVPAADGSTRFYLLSDDNGSSSQRTLLLAFDWRPK